MLYWRSDKHLYVWCESSGQIPSMLASYLEGVYAVSWLQCVRAVSVKKEAYVQTWLASAAKHASSISRWKGLESSELNNMQR